MSGTAKNDTAKNDPAKSDTGKGDDDTERIAKVMARAGLCSRRDAEAWIAAGRVTVNGQKLTSPAVNVGPLDDVRVDGRPLPAAEKSRLFRYHKPRGLVTTAKDPEGRPTVFENLPDKLPRLISVGRLDLNSEGLLLLTNDGELARRLELPATGWVRRYRVRVNGRVDAATLATLADGIEIEGVRYGAIEAVLDRQQGGNAWLTMSLTEGKNREIRKVCAHFGWTVGRLIRLSYGPFQLGHLERGEVEEVPGRILRDQLGRPGGAPPLRPHQASGGKARPPKPAPKHEKDHKKREAQPLSMTPAAAPQPSRDGSEPARRKLSHERRAERQRAQQQAGDTGAAHRDRAERRQAPVERKPFEPKPAERKSTDRKPADYKPTGTLRLQPTGSKPSGKKPGGGHKPDGNKRADSKPTGNKAPGNKAPGNKTIGNKAMGNKPAGNKPAGAKRSDAHRFRRP